MQKTFALVIPLANEARTFPALAQRVEQVLDCLPLPGKVICVVDRASRDQTRQKVEEVAQRDSRFELLWAPENKNLKDAYRAGLRQAYDQGADYIIEMDGGGAHQPEELPRFLAALEEVDCAWGSRFTPGGSMSGSFLRKLLSFTATQLTNALFGTRLKDMTSGFQGFRREVIPHWLGYSPVATMHFYQTEMRYFLRDFPGREIPISYRPESSRVPWHSLRNALRGLYVLWRRQRSL